MSSLTVDGMIEAGQPERFKPKDGIAQAVPQAILRWTSMENDVAMPPIRKPRTRRPGYCASWKGKEAKLVFMAHALMENRHGLLVTSRLPWRRGQRSGIQ